MNEPIVEEDMRCIVFYATVDLTICYREQQINYLMR